MNLNKLRTQFLKNKGYSFNSETDTEVACNLIEFFLQKNNFEKAFDERNIESLPPHDIVNLGISQVPEGRRIFSRLG